MTEHDYVSGVWPMNVYCHDLTAFAAMALLYGPPPPYMKYWFGHAWNLNHPIEECIFKCFKREDINLHAPQRLAGDYARWYYNEEHFNAESKISDR